jgi:hypothetical protein
MVPATDQAPASSDTNYRLPHRNTAHLPARRNTGHLPARPNMARLPVANTTADSFSIRLNRRGQLRRLGLAPQLSLQHTVSKNRSPAADHDSTSSSPLKLSRLCGCQLARALKASSNLATMLIKIVGEGGVTVTQTWHLERCTRGVSITVSTAMALAPGSLPWRRRTRQHPRNRRDLNLTGKQH